MKEIVERMKNFYRFDFVICIIGLLIGLIFVFDFSQYISMIGRKIGLASLAMLIYYPVRYTKIGQIEWRDPYDKIYSLVILLVIGLIIAFG